MSCSYINGTMVQFIMLLLAGIVKRINFPFTVFIDTHDTRHPVGINKHVYPSSNNDYRKNCCKNVDCIFYLPDMALRNQSLVFLFLALVIPLFYFPLNFKFSI